MKRELSLLIAIFTVPMIIASPLAMGFPYWAKTYSTAGTAIIKDIAISPGGYIIAVGYSNSSGSKDAFVMKLNQTGDVIWARSYGGPSDDGATAVGITPDGEIVVAGYTKSFGSNGDAWVLKLSNDDGRIIWQRTYGGSNLDGITDLAITPQGQIIAAGYTWSFGSGSSDVWVLFLDEDGNVLWQKTYGGGGIDVATTVGITESNDIIVGGYTGSFGSGDMDAWVLRLTEDGNIVWQKTYGGNSWDDISTVLPLDSGDVLIAGRTYSFGSGNEDGWVIEINENGEVIDSWVYGTEKWDRILGLGVLNEKIILAGYTSNFGENGDSWIVLLSNWSVDRGLILRNAYVSTLITDKDKAFGGGHIEEEGVILYVSPQGLILNSTGIGLVGKPVEIQAKDSKAKIDTPSVQVKNSLANPATLQVKTKLIYAPSILNIVSNPPKAQVYINGKYIGVTPLNISLPSGTYEIGITKEKYERLNTTVVLYPGEQRSLVVNLTPNYGFISVYSTPSGAKVYIDDTYIGKTPIEHKEVQTGRHEIAIEKEGYQNYTKTIEILPNKTILVNATLKAIEGGLYITSNPSEADVYINGSYRGKTPLYLVIPVGKYEVKVTKEGYANYTTEVEVKAWITTSIKVNLEPQYAYLWIESHPRGAKVYIDGKPVGKTPLKNYKLLSGKHVLKLALEGYVPYEKEILLRPNETLNITIDLKPEFTETGTPVESPSSTEKPATQVSNINAKNGSAYLYAIGGGALLLVLLVLRKLR